MKPLEGYRILVVEDDAMLIKLLSATLTAKGAKVLEAENGAEGLKQLAQQTVDLVVSDVQMPVMDGLKMLETLRGQGSRMPVVLLVTGQAPVTEAQSMKLGAAGLLKKPVRSVVLIAKIMELLSSGVIARAG